jgi:hypothetical protein
MERLSSDIVPYSLEYRRLGELPPIADPALVTLRVTMGTRSELILL